MESQYHECALDCRKQFSSSANMSKFVNHARFVSRYVVCRNIVTLSQATPSYSNELRMPSDLE